ncbi:hypothetical protein [Scytonema sp. HK-05]|nr:hypothetical protein [Scytonema sp. HK-05]
MGKQIIPSERGDKFGFSLVYMYVGINQASLVKTQSKLWRSLARWY